MPKAVITLFCLLLSIFLLAPGAGGKQIEITILHSNNVMGYLFPCPS